MATPQEKLANALEKLRRLQTAGHAVLRSGQLERRERELLVENGFIEPIINGWYAPANPDAPRGDTTAWYASYWDFVRTYLTERLGDEWSLSPEQSLSLHAGQWSVPAQLLVRAPNGRNQKTDLIHGASIYEARLDPARGEDLVEVEGLRAYTPEAALVAAGPGAYVNAPTEMRTVLSLQRDASALLSRLLDGRTHIAGRLAGAFRNIGRNRDADAIIAAMRSAGYDIRENDPFETRVDGAAFGRDRSAYAQRIRLLWENWRGPVRENFPPPPKTPIEPEGYLQGVDDLYQTDAYHSLSIEGYRVSPDLIERVRRGAWNPQVNADDRRLADGLAARGYWEAFQAVRASVRDVLTGANCGKVADRDHGAWYRALFSPSVRAGLLKPASLAGYRGGRVFISKSRHVPMHADGVRDAMPVFFELLAAEPDPAVRVVLGHFIFVYIHPYVDGNGRMGRFLMNLMMAAGGYPWTVIPVQARDDYMTALEAASHNGDIVPFAQFLAHRVGRDAPTAE
ncbi:Fic family protein [Caulobacter segnis]|nr:Fic family protein [Caulobacter segnis]